jgi:hypothetical protein
MLHDLRTNQLDSGRLDHGGVLDEQHRCASFSLVYSRGCATSAINTIGQLIYIFNGIEISTMIYQLVLQWGSNGIWGFTG